MYFSTAAPLLWSFWGPGGGSRGQQRTGVLCLKVLELQYIEQKTSEKPLLLLDDIFSELDENYRKSLQKIIHSQQTIITSADVKSVPGEILENTDFVKLS